MAPKSRRLAFGVLRRKKHLEARGDEPELGVAPDGIAYGQEAHEEDETPAEASESQLAVITRSLWRTSYADLFAEEVLANRVQLGRSAELSSLADGMQLSRYARRLKGEQAAAWERRRCKRERDQLATELHMLNMRHWSPSMVARSIAYFSMTTSWMHQVESGQRRLASRPTTFRMLRMMRDRRPEPEWDEGVHVSVYARACLT